MTRVFVDSSVWIDYLRGVGTRETFLLMRLLGRLASAAPEVADGTSEGADILVGDLVLAEVLRGVGDDRQHARVRGILLAFEQVGLGGTVTALAAADHYRFLRRRGVTIRKLVDCLIAAWCIEQRVPLLHADRDFAPFAAHCGLRVA